MEKSSFFNSVGGDRVYKAEEWAEYFASFIGNGVFPIPSNGLQVEANSSAGVVIRAGRAWINGYFYFNTDDLNVKLNTADGVLNRIDRIVIRWDLTARTISAAVKSSAPSITPTAPALQRDADAYELCLADVFVRAGSTAVLQSDITDQRYNSGLCGVVKGTVDQIDASMLAKQFNDYAELFKQETKLDFEAWFEEIRGILSEDLAGSLALAVDDINRSKGQPGGIATLDDGGKLVQMPTAEDVAAIPLSQKGIANGIATLNGNGKLVQMPTAADVGAVPSSAYLPLVPYYSSGATTGDSAIYFAAEGLTPGVYLLLASGNHNPSGAAYYRSVCSAILLLSCGYNSTAKQVVYRVKIGTSSSASGTSGVADSNFTVGFEGMAAEIQRTAATAKVFIRLSRDSASSTADNWDVRLHKLI